jgi:hypothetical protein
VNASCVFDRQMDLAWGRHAVGPGRNAPRVKVPNSCLSQRDRKYCKACFSYFKSRSAQKKHRRDRIHRRPSQLDASLFVDAVPLSP